MRVVFVEVVQICGLYRFKMKKKKLIKVSTVPMSLDSFCRGQLRMLRQYYDVVVVSSPEPELQMIAEREGVRTIAVAMERHISLWKDLRSLWQMVRVFRKEKPYIVHSMTPKAGLISMMAAWICRVPVRMHTYTGLVFPTATGLMKHILILTDRILCFCATDINPESLGVKGDLERYHITRKPLRLIANGNVRGVDMTYYDRTPEVMAKTGLLRRPDVFTFCFVGRLVGDKGINELVEAFDRLHREIPATRLLLVGPYENALDPLKPQTDERIHKGDGIEAVGSQNDPRPFYAASDALAFPSYREGMPNVVLEAGALGLPSIVTDINGSREIIREGYNGVIIPPHDANALYQAMRDFTVNRDETARLAANARKNIADRYEQQMIWQALLVEYKRLEK